MAVSLDDAGATWTHKLGLVGLVFLPPDERRLLSSGVDDTAVLWDAPVGGPLRAVRRFSGPRFRFNEAGATSNGRRVLTDGADANASLWDLETGTLVQVLRGSKDGFRSVDLSREGSIAATSSIDGDIAFWSTATAGPIRSLHEDAVAIALDADGSRAFWVEAEAQLCHASVHGTEPPRCMPIEGDMIGASVTPTETLTFDRFSSVNIWDSMTGRHLREWVAHRLTVHFAAFSATTGRAVTTGPDHAMRIWDTRTGKRLAERPVPGITGPLAISNDGTRVAYGTEAGEVKLWELGALH
ncbi:MAG TPA: hypothetical protein VK841_00145 [Polyangiaceae bacterium]|nr:hypothetical protein [Polyangiaceae bacterium]